MTSKKEKSVKFNNREPRLTRSITCSNLVMLMSKDENYSPYNDISNDDIALLLKKKYKLVYSDRLGKKVYVLNDWVDKAIFKRHKKLFGYTDVGWTVKHPKQLIRVLVKEGFWVINKKLN